MKFIIFAILFALAFADNAQKPKDIKGEKNAIK